MCLGIPGRVTAIVAEEGRGAFMGTVDFGGVRKEVCLAYVPDVRVGEYVIVHVGFAITRVDEASAAETLRTLTALGLLDEELGAGAAPDAPACPVPPPMATAAREPASAVRALQPGVSR